MSHCRYIMIILFMLLFIFPLDNFISANCFIDKQFHVQVIDDLPPDSSQLKVHCASKDNDLGDQFLFSTKKDFTWSFCEDFFNRTLYFCHFWWGTKESTFDVFNDPRNCIHDGPDVEGTTKCVWTVRSDGFYLGYYDNNGNFIDDLTYTWPS
ncbi:hypothetical protein P3S68_033362 [Capsicum galapagoense]